MRERGENGDGGTTVQLVSRNRIVTGIWTVLPNVVWHFTNLFSKITENTRRVERNRQILDKEKRYPAFGFVCYVYVFVYLHFSPDIFTHSFVVGVF